MKLPELIVKDYCQKNPIWQGGMGAGISRARLASAVSREGGLGIISSVGLDAICLAKTGRKIDIYTAVREEIEKAKDLCGGGPIGINVMRAVYQDYEPSVRAAIDAGVDAIISGAGLPMNLPSIQLPGHTALVPIVSSFRGLRVLITAWSKCHYRPDAVVLEGPMAGGHLGFKFQELEDPEFALEKLLPPVLDLAHKNGDIPVIVAGGIFTHEDIIKFLTMGASGVQLGTRFLGTHESDASLSYKQALVAAEQEDIIVVSYPERLPASSAGLPFRTIRSSPALTANRLPKCTYGYLLRPNSEGKLYCPAMPQNPESGSFLCPCSELLASCDCDPNEPELYTVGSNAYRVKEILSVAKLMAELRGE
jgi:nitronate monooxygenase